MYYNGHAMYKGVICDNNNTKRKRQTCIEDILYTIEAKLELKSTIKQTLFLM